MTIKDTMTRLMALPYCPKCGYVFRPGESSQGCPSCEKLENARLAELTLARKNEVKRLGGCRAYQDFTLEKYDRKDIIAAAQKAPGFPDNNLYLYGLPGRGKSHLAAALLRKTKTGRVLHTQEIIRAFFGKGEKETEDMLDRLVNEPLVIEDLGAEKASEYSYSCLYEIIDRRDMNEKTGLIITSNLAPTELPERLVSRLLRMCRIIHIEGPDRRLDMEEK